MPACRASRLAPMAKLRRAPILAALGFGVWALAAAAGAESAFVMPAPSEWGAVPARAFDPEGDVLPLARLATERRDDGVVEIRFEAGEPGAARMRASALLEPVAAGGGGLRLVHQRSASYAADGRPLRALEVDHRGGHARCYTPDGRVDEEIDLGPRDRIVNVPMNLFFQPLVRGEAERLEFELFLCRGGAQRVDFEAWVASTDDPRGVQVRYAPDFGVASLVARGFVPDLAFWFDPRSPHRWQGHRLPLYANGPEVTVLREPGPGARVESNDD